MQFLSIWFRRTNAMLISGSLIMLMLLAGSIIAPLLFTLDPLAIDAARKLDPPSANFLLGTDEFGRDTFARIVFGAHVSLRVAFAATALTAVVGIVLGTLSGQYRWADAIVGRISD